MCEMRTIPKSPLWWNRNTTYHAHTLFTPSLNNSFWQEQIHVGSTFLLKLYFFHISGFNCISFASIFNACLESLYFLLLNVSCRKKSGGCGSFQYLPQGFAIHHQSAAELLRAEDNKFTCFNSPFNFVPQSPKTLWSIHAEVRTDKFW